MCRLGAGGARTELDARVVGSTGKSIRKKIRQMPATVQASARRPPEKPEMKNTTSLQRPYDVRCRPMWHDLDAVTCLSPSTTHLRNVYRAAELRKP